MDIKIFNKDTKFKYRVSGIVITDNKILLEQYKDDSYCLPGGYVQFGETSEAALLREMFEETGLEFKISKYVGVVENFFLNKKNDKTHEIDMYYLIESDNIKELNLSRIEKGEHSDILHNFSWINLKELNNIHLLPSELKKEIINKSIGFHIIIQ